MLAIGRFVRFYASNRSTPNVLSTTRSHSILSDLGRKGPRQPMSNLWRRGTPKSIGTKSGKRPPSQEKANAVRMDDRPSQSESLKNFDTEQPVEEAACDALNYSGTLASHSDVRSSSRQNDMSFRPGRTHLEFTGTGKYKTAHVSSDDAINVLPTIRDSGRTTPKVYEEVKSLRHRRQELTRLGHSVGFVPTMGALHEGHLDLMRAAASKCNEVWISIYVNPTQFGANEDISTYPSTWEADLEKIEKLNDELTTKGHSRVSTIFRPRNPKVLYPYGVEGTSHVIINPELTQILEGASRPTFFRGVTTVVMKLLNIVHPDRVFFGQKDIQQFAVIKRMIREFHMQVHLERVPTTREPSGLAMSSRNAYLGERRLKAATILSKMLAAAKQTFLSLPPAERTRQTLLDAALQVFNDEKQSHDAKAISDPSVAVQFELDYLSLADTDSLQEIAEGIDSRGAIMSLAVYFQPLHRESIREGEKLGINDDSTVVRLIDNELLGSDEEQATDQG